EDAEDLPDFPTKDKEQDHMSEDNDTGPSPASEREQTGPKADVLTETTKNEGAEDEKPVIPEDGTATHKKPSEA
ncbi:hypothetical protein FRB90_009195, partial [Tulasnella sp. 427]